MRNSHNITLTNNDSLTEDEETTWSLPGAVVGFISWLFALAMPMLIYGSNTLFFFIYTWPFFLALMPVAVVVGIALHSFCLLYTSSLDELIGRWAKEREAGEGFGDFTVRAGIIRPVLDPARDLWD